MKRREPLRDATNRVNNRGLTPSSDAGLPALSKIPHHESLNPGGTLQIRNPSSPSPSAAEDKRLSAITNESQRNSNRDSQISTVSTNASGKSRRRKTHVGPWRLGKTLGKGASSRVRKARHAVTGQDAAVKIVSKQVAKSLRTESLANMDTIMSSDPSEEGEGRKIPRGIEREVVIMKLIEHPHIISLYDVWENRGEL